MVRTTGAVLLLMAVAAAQGADDCFNPEQRALLEAVNAARAQARECGKQSLPAAPPLRWNCRIAAVAEEHSLDMATNDFIGHEGSDGNRVLHRLREGGYSPKAWGENVSAGREQAAPTVHAWLDSPQHCVNLMKRSFTDVGGARAHAGDSYYRWYWTVVFARPQR